MNLLEQCKARSGVSSWVLNHGPIYTLSNDAPNSLKLDYSIDTPEKVEAATLREIFSIPRSSVFRFDESKEPLGDNHPHMRVLNEVLWLNKVLYKLHFFGPYLLLLSIELVQYCKEPEKLTKSCQGITGIQDVIIPDLKFAVKGGSYTNGALAIALVQVTPDVIRMLVGNNFIQPQIRSDFFGSYGIAISI